MRDLFAPVSRDERQAEAVTKWLQSRGKGTIIACTGFGKTRVAINCIKKVLTKYPNIRVLVVVPTDTLKDQWTSILDSQGLSLNVIVQIINTAAKNGYECDMLVIDEIHRSPADCFSKVFTNVKYKLILGLTATLERLDGKHAIVEKYCPVIDEITLEVAKVSGWVSNFTEYQVIISADDIEEYKKYNKEFVANFEFFNFDFGLAMSMLGQNGVKNKLAYRDKLCPNGTKEEKSAVLKQITVKSAAFMRALQSRKKYIYNHPQKIEIAKEIIKHRSDKKIITFSANTKMAESVGIGYVYTGKEGKKKNRITVDEFSKLDSGVINSCQLANEGFDCAGLSVGIVMGLDSSSIKSTQRTGRVVRKEGSKYAEMFTLVLEDTVECEWYRKAHPDGKYETIDVENLMKLLRGEPYETYKKKVKKFTYRF
jgi:superfamily II DNA or RNA helicase